MPLVAANVVVGEFDDAGQRKGVEPDESSRDADLQGQRRVVEAAQQLFSVLLLGVVILKADPSEAQALREHNSHITPGYHMNKKHWITVEGGTGVDKKLVRELVTDSYLLVVSHLPKAEQPVDPHTYGTSTRAPR